MTINMGMNLEIYVHNLESGISVHDLNHGHDVMNLGLGPTIAVVKQYLFVDDP